MSKGTLKPILIAMWAIAIAGIVLSIWDAVARELISVERLGLLVVLVFGLIGSLIVLRHPNHPVGWTFLAAFSFTGVDAAASTLVDRFPANSTQLATSVGFIEAYRDSVSVGVWLSLLIFPALFFPNGELPSPRWQPFFRVVVALLIVEMLNPQLSATWFPEDENFVSVPILGAIAEVTEGALVLAAVIAPVSLVLRFRRSRGVERQQIKWPLFSALLATIGIGGVGVIYVLGRVSGLEVLQLGEAVGRVGLALESLSVMTFPFTIGIGILRYRLYDIDLLINRTLVYGTLTTLLAATYFGSVLLAQQIFPAQSPITVVLSTLAIVALFSPLRRRIQAVIDKRFYRQRYDARQTLAKFSEELRDDIDLDDISQALLNVVDETVLPEHASLWLRKSKP